MKLHSVHSVNIRGECLAIAANPANSVNREVIRWANSARAVVALLDIIEHGIGTDRWVKFSHGELLSFFAFDPEEVIRQQPQVIISCRPRWSEIKFLLPNEYRPWTYASSIAMDIPDAAELVLDGLSRCESRREHLIEDA